MWLLVALTLGGLVGETPGHAQSTEHLAGLVILDEGGGVGYALVAFEEGEISGIELLRRSGAEPVTVSFGGLGEGVCGIGPTGCAVDVCRRRMCQTGASDSPYWQSFAASEGGTWAALQLGASADRVGDGDVRLWAWTAETPSIATLTLSDISTEIGGSVDDIVWKGAAGGGGGTDSSVWLGVALVAAAGLVAGGVTLRARSRAR